MRTRRGAMRLAGAGLAGLLAAGATSGADEIEIYRCQHRPTWELLPIAESAMGGAGRVAEDGATASLILSGPAGRVARVLAILEAVDVPPKTLELHYEIVDEADLAAAGIQLDWRRGPGGIELASVDLRGAAGRTRSHTRGRVRVQEGSEGRIATGELIPVPVGRRGGVMPIAAEQGLVARPQVMGDGRVKLDLRLTDAERNYDRRGRPGVAYTDAESQLLLAAGESAVVGAIDGDSDQGEIGTGGADHRRASRRKLLVIRAEIVP